MFANIVEKMSLKVISTFALVKIVTTFIRFKLELPKVCPSFHLGEKRKTNCGTKETILTTSVKKSLRQREKYLDLQSWVRSER